jgi:hypothetical protein
MPAHRELKPSLLALSDPKQLPSDLISALAKSQLKQKQASICGLGWTNIGELVIETPHRSTAERKKSKEEEGRVAMS